MVTLRVAVRVWNLRSRRCFRLIESSLEAARGRFGLRVIEFSVLGNHLHLVVEADDSEALSRGMQGRLRAFHGRPLILPRETEDRPDRLLLERRWKKFAA